MEFSACLFKFERVKLKVEVKKLRNVQPLVFIKNFIHKKHLNFHQITVSNKKYSS